MTSDISLLIEQCWDNNDKYNVDWRMDLDPRFKISDGFVERLYSVSCDLDLYSL